ncbi:cytochrome P450 [Streptomyces sp. 8P21H-1]|nr:cytochrome P450 [Streptomyces sp. 8P21H-1]NSL42690.1 cytochrome P450 [Streptomyces sp. 8P21H-1]
MPDDEARKSVRYHFDRHAPGYRERFVETTEEMQDRCPVAWTDTHGGHFVAASHQAVFDIARSTDKLSNDHDVNNERRGYKGITIPPPPPDQGFRGGFLEMDPPEQRYYRQALNPYLSPAAVQRWVPFLDELIRACLDERIESGEIDFVEGLANPVPAVFTLAMMGIPLKKWQMYNEPAHAGVYTPPDSPDRGRVRELHIAMMTDIAEQMNAIRATPRPGLVDAVVNTSIGDTKPSDMDLLGVLALLIGGGFDTTTALTGRSLEWLSHHPEERERLSRERARLLDPATEEFLRFFTPAVGDGRTVSEDCALAGQEFKEGDRIWLSWAMANRDPSVFPDPNNVHLERKGNRHQAFGLGIHRCIGSNVARVVFKRMLSHVLDRMPNYVCSAEGTVHYDSVGIINGMRHLPATFAPGKRLGPGLDETLAKLQKACDEQGLAAPVTARGERVDIR